jgi:hypothetical protein
MKISEVKTAKRVGDFALRSDGHANRINFEWDPRFSREERKSNLPRVYLITSNKIIKKIGGSMSKGGIAATLSFYLSSMTGSPGTARFILHLLIEQELREGHEVELFLITAPTTTALVPGLFAIHSQHVAAFKEMEDRCKADYLGRESRYPDWNFQENSQSYPSWAAKLHNEYHQRRLMNTR